jgi:hypothetical protein
MGLQLEVNEVNFALCVTRHVLLLSLFTYYLTFPCVELIDSTICPNIGAHCARELDKTPLQCHPRKRTLASFYQRLFA